MAEKKYFGTDGIRGQVGKARINAEFMLKLGWAVGKVLAKSKHAQVIIGRDTRISGTMVQSAMEAGLTAAGVNVKLLGVLPTPAIAHLTHSLRAQAGIVISASHNPFQDNGVKFFNAKGMKLSDQVELEIEAQIDQPMRTNGSDNLGAVEMLTDACGRYVEFCKSTFPSGQNLKGIKVVVDCANGATYLAAPQILHELGAEVIAINNTPDGFNINHECGATDVRALQKRVIEANADLGIALDGDGDRLIMVDHLGERVDGDEILCILAQEASVGANKNQGVIGTVMSNLGLEQALQRAGVAFKRVSVGDRYVLDALQRSKWVLGGESSGHIVNLNHTTTGDGMITALQVLRMLQQTAKSLHDLKQVMTKRPQVLINVPVYGSKDVDKFPKVMSAVADVEKQLGDSGRVLLRASGTEPLIRVMIEGNDEKVARKTAQFLADIVAAEMAQG